MLEPLLGGGGGPPDGAVPAGEVVPPVVLRREEATVERTADRVEVEVEGREEALVEGAAAVAVSLARTEGMGRVFTVTEEVRGLTLGLVPVNFAWEPMKERYLSDMLDEFSINPGISLLRPRILGLNKFFAKNTLHGPLCDSYCERKRIQYSGT